MPRHRSAYESAGQLALMPASMCAGRHAGTAARSRYRARCSASSSSRRLFNGRQPDHHSRDVAIRHWDSYWFGKRQLWGHTFPHYWSTLTALAFHHFGKATGDAAYAARADQVVRNNLSLFTAEGRASAAFIYPASVNGIKAHVADPYANDQDWSSCCLPRAVRNAGNEAGQVQCPVVDAVVDARGSVR